MIPLSDCIRCCISVTTKRCVNMSISFVPSSRMKKKRSKEGKEEKDFHVQIFKHMKSLVNKYKRWKT